MDLATNSKFLVGALSALSDRIIVADATPLVSGIDAPRPFDLDCLHKHTLTWMGSQAGPATSSSTGVAMTIHVLTISGEEYGLNCNSNDTIENVKVLILVRVGTPIDQQRLIHGGQQLEDSRTLADYHIHDGSTIHVILRLRGGGQQEHTLDAALLDPVYNYDFTKLSTDAAVFKRGGKEYTRPYGWNRVAFKVKGKYVNDNWLGGAKLGAREDSMVGEWPVSYHGTRNDAAQIIAAQGFKLNKGTRFKFGYGIYSTPDPDVAENYSQRFDFGGKTYKIMLQNRVNMVHTKVIQNMNYFVTSNDDSIRPYGLLFKKM
eukprot:Lankesteria_metandrocarpae@DN374_c0_g1_i1.p1